MAMTDTTEQREIQRLREKVAAAAHVGETRALPWSNIEVREGGSNELVLAGHAAVFDRVYEVGQFDERIAPGAFKRTLREDPDVVFWAAHGEGGHLPLARTKNGTLALAEDAVGLHYTARMDASDPDAQSLYRKVKRGDLDGASFMFRVTQDDWADGEKGRQLRTVRQIALHKGDVSPLAYGANPSAYVSARSLRATAGDETVDRTSEASSGVRRQLDYTTGARAWLDAEMAKAGMDPTAPRRPRPVVRRRSQDAEWLEHELNR